MLLDSLRERMRSLDCAGRGVLVAVSGGLDSVALLHALHQISHALVLNLRVGHVNHGLRGAEADADQAFVAERAATLGLPFRAARVAPSALREGRSSRARPTLQEAARRLRYEALGTMAAELDAQRIATAHTADDQAETVLLRVLRGTAPSGLAGIPARSPDGRIVRPWLRTFRAELERFARERGLSWREDPSNRSERFARSRLRGRLAGLARDFNPKLLRALVDLAEAQERENAWIEVEVAREAGDRLFEAQGALWIEAKDWSGLPEALAWRLAREALRRAGGGRDVSRAHLARVVAFLAEPRAGKRLELPGGLVLAARGPRFRLSRTRLQLPLEC
jgi:tRNA(Ile)-lysidine synthase